MQVNRFPLIFLNLHCIGLNHLLKQKNHFEIIKKIQFQFEYFGKGLKDFIIFVGSSDEEIQKAVAWAKDVIDNKLAQ